MALSSGRGYASAQFRGEAARRVIPGLALHTDVGPDDPMGAVVGFVLAVLASSGGFGVPEGGAGAITAAILYFIAHAVYKAGLFMVVGKSFEAIPALPPRRRQS